MKHKYETWKQIKSITGQIEFASDEYDAGQDNDKLTSANLFHGSKSHDMGSILLT